MNFKRRKDGCRLTDIDSLTTSVDEYAEKAQQTHQVSWITKSKSFRRSAKEKSAEVTAVEEHGHGKVLEKSWKILFGKEWSP